jgi:hypothetical protein
MRSFLSGFFRSGPKQNYKVADVYSGLRKTLFETKPETIGIAETDSISVWAVVMETGYPTAVATLVAIADRTVSIYFSNGGGIIGLGPHAGPRRASESLLQAAPQFLPLLKLASDFSLPSPSFTRFFLLTNRGTFTAEAREKDLGEGHHALSGLFHQGQELLTEVRLVEQQRSANKAPKGT